MSAVCKFCGGRGDRPVVPGGELDLEGWSDLECGACHGTGVAPVPGSAHGVRGPGQALCAPTFDAVCELVAACRLDLGVEQRAQADLEAVLVSEFGPAAVSREHRLGPGDRPDFLIAGGIVVELKGPRHRGPAVLRQVERYAAHAEVAAILVGTARAMHLPGRVGARNLPLRTINLGRAWL